jgi:DNA-binding SARP family transcriptional activator
MLKVKLFGSGQAYFFDRTLGGFPGQQGCPILCYLLLNRDYPLHRERLASVFWGDYPTQISKKNLRNNLWRLRQTLQSVGAPPDDFLLINEESVSFISTSVYWLDIEVFEKISIEMQTIDGNLLTYDQAIQLESAANLYIGDLLESNYDDWCLYDRERLRLMNLGNLNKLVTFHSHAENYEKGIDFAGRILLMDHTYERIHRQLMWMHWCLGNRNAALTQYRQCCQIMHDELGVAPMEETRLLYDKIKTGQNPSPTSANETLVNSNRMAMRNQVPLTVPDDALTKLKRLQRTVKETREELDQIERLLHEALSGSDAG